MAGKWLITYEFGLGLRNHTKKNIVITESPMKWLKRMRKDFPDGHYVLLFAMKVPKEEADGDV